MMIPIISDEKIVTLSALINTYCDCEFTENLKLYTGK